MKILFVCQQYIHSARWINQLKDAGHEIFVFDCLDRPVHKELTWVQYIGNWSKRKIPYIKGEDRLKKSQPKLYEKVEGILKVTPAQKLEEVIREIQPDLVHSLEMQSQTYHVEKVRRKLNFVWAYSSWGSDLYLYQKDSYHRSKIQKSLSKIDYFFSDNTRDLHLAKQLGFQGKMMPVFPGGGGYHLENYQKYIQPLEQRNTLIIKGYHHWVGRALVILEALERLMPQIKELNIYVYSAHPIVIERIQQMNQHYGVSIRYTSRDQELDHEELIEKFGQAKIAVASSLSDGIPNTLLESMICGAFPIQTNPGGVTEQYITDGENGLLIENAEDVDEIAKLISKALKDAELLQKAFQINQKKAKQLAYATVQQKVVAAYQHIEKAL